MMTSVREPNEYCLMIKTVTWQKDSHSLFDYEYNKIVIQTQEAYDLEEKFMFIYRNNSSNSPLIQTPKSSSGE